MDKAIKRKRIIERCLITLKKIGKNKWDYNKFVNEIVIAYDVTERTAKDYLDSALKIMNNSPVETEPTLLDF